MRKSLKVFSSIACNSIIASNKQRQQHSDLATIQRAKLKGAHVLEELWVCKLSVNPNMNGHDSHWGVLLYDNNECKRELDETHTSIVNFFSKP